MKKQRTLYRTIVSHLGMLDGTILGRENAMLREIPTAASNE